MSKPVDELTKIVKDLSDSAEVARFALEDGRSSVAECYARTEAAQLEAKARLLQWGTEQYKKGYIDGGIGVINEKNI